MNLKNEGASYDEIITVAHIKLNNAKCMDMMFDSANYMFVIGKKSFEILFNEYVKRSIPNYVKLENEATLFGIHLEISRRDDYRIALYKEV